MTDEIKAGARQAQLLAELRNMTPAEILALPVSEESRLLDKNLQDMRRFSQQAYRQSSGKRPRVLCVALRKGKRSANGSIAAFFKAAHMEKAASTDTCGLTVSLHPLRKRLISDNVRLNTEFLQRNICISPLKEKAGLWLNLQALHDPYDKASKTAA